MKAKTCNRTQVQHGWKVIWYDIQTFHPTQLMHDLQSTPSESLSTNNTNSKKEDTKYVFICGANDASILEHTCVLHPFLEGVVSDDYDNNNNDGSVSKESKAWTLWNSRLPKKCCINCYRGIF